MLDHLSLQQGSKLGRYQLSQALGGGNMGIVWQARDEQYQRQVVIKMLPGTLASNQRYLETFLREARIAASLNHPHILPIHDFGEEQIEGGFVVPYLVMPYIDGGTLMERMRSADGALAPQEGLHFLKQAALAIDFAHSQQVVHRDIKPANMLLRSDDWLLLSDFGIAKRMLTDSTRTHAGSGTPEYMAPEQARGEAVAASDRYSLAIIAYMLLTGYVPFSGKTPYDTLFKHLTEEPPTPTDLNPALPLMAETVLLRGLAKKPGERYTSCQKFVEDLERAFHGRSLQLPPLPSRIEGLQPVSALLPETPFLPTNLPPDPILPSVETANKMKRRAALMLGGAALVAVVGAGGILLNSMQNTNIAPPRSTASVKPTASPPGPQHLTAGQPILNLKGHTANVNSVRWDKTGRYLATGAEDRRVLLWDLGSALSTKTLRTDVHSIAQWRFANPLLTRALDWSPDGKMLAVADGEQKFFVFDPLTPNSPHRQLLDSQSPLPIYSYYRPVWRPNHQQIAAMNQSLVPGDTRADLWQIDAPLDIIGTFKYEEAGLEANLSAIGWSVDGSRLAGLLLNAGVVIWDGQTQSVLRVYRGVASVPVKSKNKPLVVVDNSLVVWSPTDPNVLAAWNRDTLNIYDIRKNEPLMRLGIDDAAPYIPPPEVKPEEYFAEITSFVWSPNGRYIAGSYKNSGGRIYIWDIQAKDAKTIRDGLRAQKMFFPGSDEPAVHTNLVIGIDWSPDGKFISTASWDKSIVVWRVEQ